MPAPDHWWRADGDASNAVSAAHGTIVGGVTYDAGRFGQAFRFDGISSEVTFGTTAGNLGTNDFTIAYWQKTTNTGVAYVMSKRPVCGHSSFWDAAMTDGSPSIELDQDAAGSNYFSVGMPALPADNQWHHVAVVRRGTNLFCYRDAVLGGATITSGITRITNSALMKAGSSPCAGFSGTKRFSGLLDEIKLYSCALSASQIAEAAGIPDPNRPTLNIAALPGAVRLTWTTNATGYLLETNNSLTLPSGWGVLTSNYNVIETNYAVTNIIGGATRFYRLHKP